MFEEVKRSLAREARYLALQGLVAGREGNISRRVGDKVVIKGSGVRMLSARSKDFAVINIDGDRLEGPPPSSEYRMHLMVYGADPNARAVVHVHPPYTLALLRIGVEPKPYTLEAEHYYSLVCNAGRLPPGSLELAKKVSEFVSEGCNVITLMDHGMVTVGSSVDEAVDRAAAEERSSQVQLLSLLGQKNLFSSRKSAKGQAGGGVFGGL